MNKTELDNLNAQYLNARMNGDIKTARHIKSLIQAGNTDQAPDSLSKARVSEAAQVSNWQKSYQRSEVRSTAVRSDGSAVSFCPGAITSSFALERAKKASSVSATRNVSVAPAAIVSCAEVEQSVASFLPRGGNTGITPYDDDITEKISTYRYVDDQISAQTSSIVKLDWFSCSFPDATDELSMNSVYAAVEDFLTDHSINIRSRGKGFHGYQSSSALILSGDSGADQNVGMLAYSSRQGLFVELSGKGCDLVVDTSELYSLVKLQNGRISRCDLALDLPSDWCRAKGHTVPKFLRSAAGGAYRFGCTPAHVTQRMTQEGQWVDMLVGDLTIDQYDPSEHSLGGLTAYVGSTQSANQVVFYEKGKQLLGLASEDLEDSIGHLLSKAGAPSDSQRHYLLKIAAKNEMDLTQTDARHWVRVERRFRRGTNKKFLAPEMLLHLDSAFASDNLGLESLLNDYREYCSVDAVRVVDFRKKAKEVEKSLLLTRKIYWAKQSYGRLIKELEDNHFSAAQIVDSLKRSVGLKDVIFDLV